MRSLEEGGVDVPTIADELGVSKQTVYNYLSGKHVPSRSVLRVWALRCGVQFDWLRGADEDEPRPPSTGVTSRSVPVEPPHGYVPAWVTDLDLAAAA